MGWYDKDWSKGDEDVYQRVIMLMAMEFYTGKGGK